MRPTIAIRAALRKFGVMLDAEGLHAGIRIDRAADNHPSVYTNGIACRRHTELG
jgi:hypothetical protein